MSILYMGDYDTTETVHIPLNAFTSDDPAASCTITNLAAGDVEIHKDGSTTQRASDSGVTVNIDFDTVTGNHTIDIDLSDNADAGFYADGSRYMVRVEGITVDGGTLNSWIAIFSIGCVLRPTTAGRKLDVSSGGEAGIDWANIGTPNSTVDLSDTTIKLCDTVTTNTDMRGTDSAALASVLGALADAAADGDPSEAETLMQYIKQLINILIGTAGIVAFPDEAAPANAVSLAEVIRAIHADVTGLNGDAMRGTDGANTTVPDAAGTAAGLHTTTDALIGALNNIAASDVWDLASDLTLDFGTLLERAYQFLNNEQDIVDATGAVTLRNIGDSADLATWGITDDDTDTIKTEASWV